MDNHSFLRKFFLVLIVSAVVSSISCSTKSEGQAKFGADADYFMGLKSLSQGNEKDARLKFNRCIKKGSYYCAKKSAEALCTFGTVQEKNQAAEKLLNLFPQKDSLLIAVKQFEDAKEINKIIEYTENLDPATDKNELVRIRLKALQERNDSRYQNEVYNWFTSCSISREHYQFYRDVYEHKDFETIYTYNLINEEKLPVDYTPREFAIDYRIQLYKRNYSYTIAKVSELLEYLNSGSLSPNEQLASDIGKTYLYGSMDFANNAAFFEKLADQYKNTPLAFYFYFYAGRLYDKAGVYYQKTRNSFEMACQNASTSEQKDNALWYLINTSLSFSINSIIENIGIYAKQWSDPAYFEDIFETLISSLLASGKWNAFGQIYKEIDGYASDETVAQYAYIYGRLIQEGLTTASEEEIKKAFTRALKSGSSVYYKTMAAYQLGLEGAELENILTEPLSTPKELTDKSDAASILLEGYAFFGFPELIYPQWQELYPYGLPVKTYFILADFLAQVGKNNEESDFYSQALRIAVRGQKFASSNLSKEEIRQIYPVPYSEIITRYSNRYDINPSVVYAMIRSESFFDADITSSAGAVGLTQLMEFTAGDIAKRLKIPDYDLSDPEISINFGTYYLSELIHRCDGSYLQGFFAYNAGITRVRRWLQSSLIEFGKKSNMPADLYLETVPFAETREYGRKIISATVMYEWLENPDSFTQTVQELLK